jgi:hypothetical protein
VILVVGLLLQAGVDDHADQGADGQGQDECREHDGDAMGHRASCQPCEPDRSRLQHPRSPVRMWGWRRPASPLRWRAMSRAAPIWQGGSGDGE